MSNALNPALDPILSMEPFVCDVPRIARILQHMATSDFEIGAEEVHLIAAHLEGIGEKLVTLLDAAHKAAGGAS